MKRNFVTAFLSVVGSRVLLLGSSVVLTPAIIAFAGKSTYGEYGTLMSAWALIVIFMTDGVTSGIQKFLSEERDVPDWQNHVFGFYLRIAAALAVLTAILFVVAAYTGLVAWVWRDEFVGYFYLLAPLALVAQFRGFTRKALLGLKLEHIGEPIRVVHKVLFAAFAIGFVYFGFGVPGLVLGQLAASLLAGLVAAAFVYRRLSFRSVFRRTPDGFPTGELFSFNTLTVVYSFLLMSLYHVDILMLGAMMTSEKVAYYKAAMVITQFLWFAPRSLQSLMLQSTSNLWTQGRTERLTSMASRLTRYLLLLTLLLAIGMGALAHDFVPLYLSEEMMPSVEPLLILLPGTVGFALARPMLSINQANGDLRPLVLGTAASAVPNAVLNYLLIPVYGISGAAIATSVGYGSLVVFQTMIARHHGYEPFADARWLRVVVTALLAGVPIVLVARSIDARLVALLVVPVVGFVLFSSLSFATGAVGVDEVLEILDATPGPVSDRVRAARQRFASPASDTADPLTPFVDSEIGRTRPLGGLSRPRQAAAGLYVACLAVVLTLTLGVL